MSHIYNNSVDSNCKLNSSFLVLVAVIGCVSSLFVVQDVHAQTSGLEQYIPVNNAQIITNSEPGDLDTWGSASVMYGYQSGDVKIVGSINQFKTLNGANTYMMRLSFSDLQLKNDLYPGVHCASGMIGPDYNLWCQDGLYTITFDAANVNSFDLDTPMKQVLQKLPAPQAIVPEFPQSAFYILLIGVSTTILFAARLGKKFN